MGESARKAGINLQGMAIGDGLCDPRNQLDYGNFLFQLGLIDEQQPDHFLAEQAKVVKLIDAGEYTKAFNVVIELLIGEDEKHKSYFENVTGLNYFYNFLLDHAPEDHGYYQYYLELNKTRKALHVGSRPFNNGSLVMEHLTNDIFQSVKPWIEELLNANYRIMWYSGNLDIIVAAPLTENFLKSLKWAKAHRYYTASRKIYKVDPKDKIVAGYVKQVDNMYYTVIRNAGHIVPYDQPRVARDMITRFVKKDGFLINCFDHLIVRN